MRFDRQIIVGSMARLAKGTAFVEVGRASFRPVVVEELRHAPGGERVGAFQVGPYTCEYRQHHRRPPVVLMKGGGLTVPWVMLATGWHSAQQEAIEAAEALAAGRSPRNGVYQRAEVLIDGGYRR